MLENRNNYDDFAAAKFFAYGKLENPRFTKKVITIKETGVKVPLLHLEGVWPDGKMLNLDIWPRNNATLADIEAMPAVVKDFVFRLGYYDEVTFDPESGEQIRSRKTSAPKLVSYVGADGKTVVFSGKVHTFDESAGKYEPWTNDEPVAEDAE